MESKRLVFTTEGKVSKNFSWGKGVFWVIKRGLLHSEEEGEEMKG